MKIQKRNGVFETNSSSVHSLAINSKGRQPNKITMKDGYLKVRFGVFGCSGRFNTQEDKLSYLATLIWYIAGGTFYNNLRSMYHCYTWELLEDAVKEYVPGCKGVRVVVDDDFNTNERDYYEAPYIDHQSVPDNSWDTIVDFYDKDAVIDFIWNDYVSLKCSRD